MNYDSLGNPGNYKGKTLTWNKGRQLASYDGLAFTYDGYGRRISKGSISYVYDAGGKLIREAISSGDGAYTLEFIYQGNEIIGIKHNSTNYIYRKNAQGDITYIYGIDGTIKAYYTYDAWGNHFCISADGTKIYDSASGITAGYENHVGVLNPFRYRGYYWDTETALYALPQRYYDPEVGRFINADSVENAMLQLDQINGLNLYAFCLNNPVNYTDPTGGFVLTTFLICLAVGAVVGGTLGGITAAQNGTNVWAGIFTGIALGAAVGAVVGLGGAFLSAGISSVISRAITDVVNVAFFGGEWGSWQSYALAFAVGWLNWWCLR